MGRSSTDRAGVLDNRCRRHERSVSPSPRSLLIAAAVLGVCLAAVGLRFADLGARPMHGDEAVNAVRFARLWETGVYRYDPSEFHGPALPYLTLPVAWLGGAESFAGMDKPMFRALPAAFGVLLVLLTAATWRMIGRPAALTAAALCALSPAMVFYSRYYIHEMLLVAFTLAAILAGRRCLATGCYGWAAVFGLCIGLMHATKETCIIAWFAMAAALVPIWLLHGRRLAAAGGPEHAPGSHTPADPPPLTALLRPLAIATAVAAVISITLYSSFFTHWQGPIDSIRSYLIWIGRGAGEQTPHVHPWHWYLSRLLYVKQPGQTWSELLIVGLSLIGLVASFTGRAIAPRHIAAARFLAGYTLVMTVVYAAIPYKTPWSMLGFLHGMILTAGIGAAAVLRAAPTVPLRVIAALALAAAAAHLGWQANRAARHPVFILRNPYIYAHPTRDVERLAERAAQIARLHPDGFDMPLLVIKRDHHYWPLPYYLRRFGRVGYTTAVPPHADLPADPDRFPFIIADAQLADELQGKLDADYRPDSAFRLPPDAYMNVYIRADLWDRFMRDRR